jgi:hypothetical protein
MRGRTPLVAPLREPHRSAFAVGYGTSADYTRLPGVSSGQNPQRLSVMHVFFEHVAQVTLSPTGRLPRPAAPFQTDLDRTGCSRATKKKLMRHAAEDVTDGYAHAELKEMLAALVKLQSPADQHRQTARRTGTDDKEVTNGSIRKLPKCRPYVGPPRDQSLPVSGSDSPERSTASIYEEQRSKYISTHNGRVIINFCQSPADTDLIHSGPCTTVSGERPDTQVD